MPHPDGAGTWTEAGRAVSFLLEYDTGTENLTALTAKLDGYHVLAANLAWNEQICPVLLFCFGSPRREQAARQALAATAEATGLRIATTAIHPPVTSPAGPVWLPLHGTAGQMPLIDLDAALPDPWQDYRAQRARERREAADREQALRAAEDDDEAAEDDDEPATPIPGEEVPGSWR